VHEEVFPQSSVATNVLVVTPIGKRLPEGNPEVWLIVTLPQVSAPVTENTTKASHTPGSLLTIKSPGHVIVGGVVSITVIICVQEEELPHSSVAVHVLVMVSVLPHPETVVSL
jgi:hypothetical protein